MFPKAQDDILKCLVLSATQRYSVYCHRGVKRIFTFKRLEFSNRLTDYQTSGELIVVALLNTADEQVVYIFLKVSVSVCNIRSRQLSFNIEGLLSSSPQST